MSAPQPILEETVKYSVKYKKDNIGLLNILLLGVMLLIAGVAFLVITQLGTNPKALRFALNDKMQIIDPAPLDQEGISKPALFNWVNSFMLDAFSFNYSNQYKQPFKLTQYLNQAAMQQYTDLLSNDEDFKAITENKYVVSANMLQTPDISDGKQYQGRYAWQIKVPLQIMFSNALMRSSQEVDVYVVVLRVPESESPMGILIANLSIVLKSRQAAEAITTGF